MKVARSGSLRPDHQVEQVLERGERLAAAADEQAEVIAFDVENGLCHAEAVAGCFGIADRDVGFDAHELEQVVEHLCRHLGVVLDELFPFGRFAFGGGGSFAHRGRCVADAPCADASVGGANAQDAALRFAEDFELDVFAGRIELIQRVLDRFVYRLTACLYACHFDSFSCSAGKAG